MEPFKEITREKVVALHVLIRFLRRLDVIGKIHTCTTAPMIGPVAAMDFAGAMPGNSYSVEFVAYDPSHEEMKSEIMLEKIFDHKMPTCGWNTHFKF